ncbi:MAG: DUF427 domain-containing protein [Acidimicrobiales bacterium]
MPRAVWNGAVIADSQDVEVVDRYTYFPADAIDRNHLRRSDHRSRCLWKGVASYYDVDEDINRNAAWEYPEPSDRAAPLVRGRIAFWRGVRIEADGVRTEADDASGRRSLLSRLTGRKR